jgi:hypothetical protein
MSRRPPIRALRPGLAAAALLLSSISGCGGHWKGLRGLDFTDRSVAVVTAEAPPPMFFVDEREGVDLREPEGGLLGAIFQVGSGIYRGYQEYGVALRLDSASRMVDLPPRIAERVLQRGSVVLGARPEDDPRSADYQLEARVEHWGIVSESLDSEPYFTIKATLHLFEGPTGVELWEREVEEEDDIDSIGFAPGTVLGNLVAGGSLADLTTEDIARALEQLADYTGDRLVVRLREDLARARREDANRGPA